MRKYSLLLVLVSVSLHAQIKFDTVSWNQTLAKSIAANQSIFLHAYAGWCEPCQEMEEYVFSDLEVGNFYNRNFINVQMNMEEYPGVELAEQLAIDVYPSFLFINKDGEILHRGCGAMDANDFLLMGEMTLNENENLNAFERKYKEGDRSVNFLMNYLVLQESVCLDAEGFAREYLSSLELEELTTESAWAVMAAYNWDIYSREFQYLLQNQSAFLDVTDSIAVKNKIYDTYLSQYQEVYEADELHDFGMRSLLHSIKNASFDGADTLQLMMNLHIAEYRENWAAYADYAIAYTQMMGTIDAIELSELAWKFYLFIENKSQLEIAAGWAKEAVDKMTEPAIIDTYASLQYKLGNKRKAVDLATRALELAKKLYDDTSHFEYQLKKFSEE